MHRTRSVTLASLTLLLVGGTAGAQLPTPSFSSSPFITSGNNGLSSRPWIAQKNIVTAALNSDPLYRTPLGTGYDGVGFLIIERPDLPAGFVAICSGALLNGGANVLTAAHCLADDTGRIIATKVTAQFLPSTGGVETITASTTAQFKVNPQYTGEVIDAHDIAIVRLDNTASAGVQRYGLYSGPTQGVQFDRFLFDFR